MASDDTIKDYCCTPEARGAITHLLLDAYGPPVRTKQMDLMREEYSAGSDEREKFFENFEVSKDQTSDYIPVKEVAERVKKQKLAVTPLHSLISTASRICVRILLLLMLTSTTASGLFVTHQ